MWSFSLELYNNQHYAFLNDSLAGCYDKDQLAFYFLLCHLFYLRFVLPHLTHMIGIYAVNMSSFLFLNNECICVITEPCVDKTLLSPVCFTA